MQNLITNLYDNGLSLNTLSGIIGIISKSFRYAVIQKYIPYSPIIEVHIPKNRTPKNKETTSSSHIVIPKEWMQTIFERFPEETSSYIPLLFGYKCGMRLGEAFAITWEDINYKF